MKHYEIEHMRAEKGILYLSITPKHEWDKLKFYAGQYATIGFRSDNGRRSPMRCFSIVSSPLDNDRLQFAIRIHGRFTQSLSELPIGTDIYVQGPFGEFVVDNKQDSNLVFLAGGIGITPIVSIIRTLSWLGSSMPMTLLHGYRTADIPFKNELKTLKQKNLRLKTYHFVTQDPVPAGEFNVLSGMIQKDHIRQVTSGRYVGSTYFVCGPKPFMDKMSELLIDNGVDEDRILTESFAQSSKIYAGNGMSVQKLTYGFASALLVIGIIGISFIDLSRYVPRIAHANAVPANSISTPPSPITSSSGNSVTSGTSSNSSNYSTPPPSNYTQTYQAPVTAVS